MRTEKILAGIVFIGILFKLLHWPGAGFILVISLSIISFVYFPFAFYFFANREIKNQNLPLSIAAGFFLSIIPVGILFKLMYWPGETFLLVTGNLVSLALFFIIYFIRKRDNSLATYYHNMVKRIIVLGLASFILSLIPINTLLRIQYWNDPKLAEFMAKSYQHPENEKYRLQLEEYKNKTTTQEK